MPVTEPITTKLLFGDDTPSQLEQGMVLHVARVIHGMLIPIRTTTGEFQYGDSFLGIRFTWKPYTSPLAEADGQADGLNFHLLVTVYNLRASEYDARQIMADLLKYLTPGVVSILGLNSSHAPSSYSTVRSVGFRWREDVEAQP